MAGFRPAANVDGCPAIVVTRVSCDVVDQAELAGPGVKTFGEQVLLWDSLEGGQNRRVGGMELSKDGLKGAVLVPLVNLLIQGSYRFTAHGDRDGLGRYVIPTARIPM